MYGIFFFFFFLYFFFNGLLTFEGYLMPKKPL